MRTFVIFAVYGDRSIRAGQYKAPTLKVAIERARADRAKWAAEKLGCREEELSFEVEESFV
jgi:hypothetical protein